MPAPRQWIVSLLPGAKQLGLWLCSITIVAIVSAATTSRCTREDSLELAFKQQQLADIQRFQAGATSIDTAFRAFNDALVDDKGIDAARDAMRAAIAQHSSDTLALQRVFGEDATRSYLAGLSHLRKEIDRATAPQNAMPMAQTAVDLIEERQKMVQSASTAIAQD